MLITASTIATALLLLAGAPAAQAAELTFWHAMSGKAGEAVAAQCERFNAAQAADRITCLFQGSYERLMQKSVAAFRAGKHPQLIQFFDVAAQDLMLSGALVSVTALYRRAGVEVDWSDYLAPVRAAYANASGELVGQPYNVSTLLLYTNDAALQAAGVSAPPATWEALRNAALRLKAAGSRCPFITDVDPWHVLEQFSAVHGQAISSRRNGHDGFGATYSVNGALQTRHLQDLVAGHREGWVRLTGETRAGDMSSAFRSGECAMELDSTGAWRGIQATLGKTVSVSASPVPVYEGQARYASFVGGGAVYVMKGHSAPQERAAMAFLSFVRRPEEQVQFTRQTGFLPVTQSGVQRLAQLAAEPAEKSAEKPAEKKPKGSRELAAVTAGIAALSQPAAPSGPGVRLGFYMQFRAAWREEVQRAFAGAQSVPEALRRANARGDALLRRFELTYPQANLP